MSTASHDGVAPSGGARVSRLLRVSRTVSDLAQAAAFHCDALGFRVVRETMHDTAAWGELMGVPGARGRAVTLRLAAQELELVEFDPPGALYPPATTTSDPSFQHIALVVSDIDAAYERLRNFRHEPISEGGPVQLPPTSGSVLAYKFRDADGHPLELIQFPEAGANAIWQQRKERGRGLFLGIDHSAIVVCDLERSADFYSRTLGVRVAAHTVNSGPAQQRLDRAPDVVVDVVALQPAIAGPPHVELLGYRHPACRPMQRTRSNDIAADRLVLEVVATPGWAEVLRDAGSELVSPGAVEWPPGRRAALLRDPTGHLLLLCT